jgi:hypothetical protein
VRYCIIAPLRVLVRHTHAQSCAVSRNPIPVEGAHEQYYLCLSHRPGRDHPGRRPRDEDHIIMV